jgi:hypothetical protein
MSFRSRPETSPITIHKGYRTTCTVGLPKMSTDRLIYLAPGWGKFDLGWWFLRRRYEKMGFDVVYGSYPDRGFNTIDGSARDVERVLNALRPHYKHITFVGHSMGGLIGRYLVQVLGRADLMDAYISMGTPHKGTHVARLGVASPSAREMCPRSSLLGSLGDVWPETIPAFSLQAGLDWIVFPQNSSNPGFSTHGYIKSCTHAGLLVHPRAFLECWAWLTYTIFAENGPSETEGFSSFIGERWAFLKRFVPKRSVSAPNDAFLGETEAI